MNSFPPSMITGVHKLYHAIAFALMKLFLDVMALKIARLTLPFHTMWPWNGNMNMVVSSKQLHMEKVEFV